MAMQGKLEVFDAGMDLGTAQILLSRGCYLIWRGTEEERPDFVYKRERNIAREIPEEVVLEKLRSTIKILLGFERYQHLNYLLSIFDLSDNSRNHLIDVIHADKRIRRYPAIQRAFNETHGLRFELQAQDRDVDPFPLISKEEIVQKVATPIVERDLDWDTAFCAIPSQTSQKREYRGHRLNILLLGSFSPGMRKLLIRYHSGEPTIRDKLESGEALHKTELLLYIREILENRGHRVFLGNCDRRYQRSVWHRMAGLLEDCDYIMVFMTNTGGVVAEATMIAERNLGYKAVYYVPSGEKVSGLMKQGLFLLPQIKTIQYGTDDELLDYVVRCTEAFQADHRERSHCENDFIFHGFFNVRRDRIELSSGKEMTYDVVEAGDVVSVLAVTERNQIILCRQYRHPIGEYVLDLPAGFVKPDEDLASSARRELEEETGYIAEDIRHLGTFYPLAGITSMRLHYFLATKLQKGVQKPDSTESIEVTFRDVDELAEEVCKGNHRDLPLSHAILTYKCMREGGYL